MYTRTISGSIVVFFALAILTISRQVQAETSSLITSNESEENHTFVVSNISITPTVVEPVPPALLSLQPQTLDILPENVTDLIIQTDNITAVYGIYVLLGFDPTILSVVDADSNEPGTQVSSGDCPQPDFVVFNTIENGSIHYEVTQFNPTPPCNGGEVASIQFQCLALNTTTSVTITESLIASPDGKIPHTTANATVNCFGYFNFLPTIFNPASP